MTIPLGLCQCGCGQPTTISPRTRGRYGHVKGCPVRFVRGHHARGAEHSEESRRKRARFGSEHPAWGGGATRDERGYVHLKLAAEHPFYAMANAKGYVKEHRLVVAMAIGRMLRPEEVVHHLNSVRDDNRLPNLLLFGDHAQHMAFHHAMREDVLT